MMVKHPNQNPGSGFILVAILVIVMLGSMVAMSLLFRLQAEEHASSAGADSEQAWLAAMSGVEEAFRMAAAAKPGGTEWRDNPHAFKDRFVCDSGSERWYFTVYSKGDEDSLDPLRYGITDEASRLNLNTASKESLLRIPGVDQRLIDSLGGKEPIPTMTFALGGLNDSNGWTLPRQMQSLGELLAFSGFNPQVLYGEDANCNLRLDPNEDDGNERPPADNHDGKLDLGLSAFLTVHSYDLNVDNKGIVRTDINDSKDPFPLVELPAALTNFITALRTNSLRVDHPADLLEAKMQVKDDKGAAVEIQSGVDKAQLTQVIDLFYGTSAKKSEGLVNVNTASIKVLAALPGMDDPLAEAIASGRRSTSPEHRTTIAWLFEEGVLDAEHFKKVAPYITARSFQFTFHVVGYSLPSRKFRALEVGIDVAGGKRSVTYLRDLTRLGLPLELQERSAEGSNQARAKERPNRTLNDRKITHG